MNRDWLSKFRDIRHWWTQQRVRFFQRENGVTVINGTEEAQAEFDLRLRLAPLMSSLVPSYGTCYRCKWPWIFVWHHSTTYENGSGCFPLCEMCWQQLGTPERRMKYYFMLYQDWQKFGGSDVEWKTIQDAVLAEGGPVRAWMAGPD